MRTLAAISLSVLLASPALAQVSEQTTAGESTMAALVEQGYEIKTSSTSGSKLIVFLQKDNSVYVCEFTSLTVSRCGSIN